MDNSAVANLERVAKLKIAERCQSDLFFLCKHILGYEDITESTHGELCEQIQHITGKQDPKGHMGAAKRTSELNLMESGTEIDTGRTEDGTLESFDPTKNFLLMLLPRGSFKSSIATIGGSIQKLLNDPDARILIDSEVFGKSKAFLMEIKGHLEGNQKLREVFMTIYNKYPDDHRREMLWSDSAINIAMRIKSRKEPSISCAGVDVPKTGMHYDLIVADDLHSERNVTTKEQIQQVIDHYKLALSLLDPEKPMIVIGTRWHYADVYQYILDNEADRFNILVRSAYNEDGSLFFPERLTPQFLERTKRSQGSYIFSCQYLNEPVDDETATFKRSEIHYKSWEEVAKIPINWFTMTDPSYEGKSSDYAASVTAGMDAQRNIYIRHVRRAKMTYGDIIRSMFDLYEQFKPKQMSIETIASAKSITAMLTDEQRRQGKWLPIKEINHRTKSKEERIKGLQPYFEFGRIFIVKECPQREELEYELIHFPKAKHDDIVDCLADLLEIGYPASGSANPEDNWKKERKKKQLKIYNKPRSPFVARY